MNNTLKAIKNGHTFDNDIEESGPGRLEEPIPVFDFITAEELLKEPKPIPWLIKGYIENNALSTLYGEPGAGKSFAAIDAACCIATGYDFHGNPVKIKGAVYYIMGEGHAGIGRRLFAWQKDRGCSLAQKPIFVSTASAALIDESSALSVSKSIEDISKSTETTPVMVVIDTLNRNFGAGDENSTRDMTAFLHNIDTLIRQKYKCHVMIVHHSGKDAAKGARGSGALKAAMDAEYELSVTADKIMTLKVTKMKDAEAPPKMSFKQKIVALPFTNDDGDQLSSLVLEKTDVEIQKEKPTGSNQRAALEILKELVEARQEVLRKGGYDPNQAQVKIEEWRKKCYEQIKTRTGKPISKGTLHRVINELEEGGTVRQTAGFVYLNVEDENAPF